MNGVPIRNRIGQLQYRIRIEFYLLGKKFPRTAAKLKNVGMYLKAQK